MRTYTLNLRDDDGCTHDVEIEAASDDAAISAARETAQAEAEDWCSGGEWGNDGASIGVRWTLTDDDDDELASGHVTVEIEPDHSSLIREATRYDVTCGDDPDDHEWSPEGEGGCDENPGVWSTGGTSFVAKSHCRKCGLMRTESYTGSQRNPGEHDTVSYEMPPEEHLAWMRENGLVESDEEE